MTTRSTLAFAVLVTATPAAAFVRSTTGADPTAPGVCLAWKSRTVSYVINSAGYDSVPGCSSASTAEALAVASFPAWEQGCTDLRFSSAGTSSRTTIGNDGVNLVVFRKGACSDPQIVPATDPCHATPGACATAFNCWEHDTAGIGANTIALTTTTFRVDTGEIVDADIELFGWTAASSPSSAQGWWFTCEAGPPCANGVGPHGRFPAGCTYIDLGKTVTHEAGHVLGLSHVCQFPGTSCDPTSIMFPTAQIGDARHTISTDDADAVCAIYPAGQAASTTNGCLAQAPPPTTRGGGCSTGAAGDLSLLAASALATRLLRKRRRRSVANRAGETVRSGPRSLCMPPGPPSSSPSVCTCSRMCSSGE
jgi:hypothetical protein